MQQTSPKTIVMPSNGTAKGFNRYLDWKAIVGSLLTGVVIGNFVFAWNTNATVAKILEKQANQDHRFDDIKGDMNQVQLDIRDLREKSIRTERFANEYYNLQLQKPTK